MFNKIFSTLFAFALVATMVACSSGEYTDSIPAGSVALVSVDAAKVDGLQSDGMLSMFFKDGAAGSGVDLSERCYLFEAADGNLGLCAKVKSNGTLTDKLDALAGEGHCTKVEEQDGIAYSVVGGKWLVAFSDKALLCMGPVVAAAQSEFRQQMRRYLKQDSEHSMSASALMNRVAEMENASGKPMIMVAQASALPEQLATIFSLGAPKEADASQVVVAAEMETTDGILHVAGKTMSFNSQIDSKIRASFDSMRPVTKGYMNSMTASDFLQMAVNVEGEAFLPILQANKGLVALLGGINQAIDINNIIKSIDGDMLLSVPAYTADDIQIAMAAKLGSSDFLKDVGYWKESCPAGSRITDWKKDSYVFTDGKMQFAFGVSDDKQFFCGSSQAKALAMLSASAEPVDSKVQAMLVGHKLSVLINLAALPAEAGGVIASALGSIFGNVTKIVYVAD